MKRILLSLLALMTAGLSAQAQVLFTPNPQIPLPENIHFYMNPDSAYEGRFPHMRPTWFIYPDGPCNREQAEALVQEMGLNDTLKDYVGIVAVLGPSDGVSYDREKDFAFYETVFNKLRVFYNLKVVGIGSGATFVNEAIAPVASEVADIVSIGGKAPKKVEGTSRLPGRKRGRQDRQSLYRPRQGRARGGRKGAEYLQERRGTPPAGHREHGQEPFAENHPG